MSGNSRTKRESTRDTVQAEPSHAEESALFAFGPRRYASKGPRRLFVPQRSTPLSEVEVQRPRALLRLRSS
jgi:hypothetical protein